MMSVRVRTFQKTSNLIGWLFNMQLIRAGLKRNATVTMNRAPMINQNITFHLPKYNSNMFCVLKVITDKLTLLCLTMYSAIFLQSLLWDLNQMTSVGHTRLFVHVGHLAEPTAWARGRWCQTLSRSRPVGRTRPSLWRCCSVIATALLRWPNIINIAVTHR